MYVTRYFHDPSTDDDGGEYEMNVQVGEDGEETKVYYEIDDAGAIVYAHVTSVLNPDGKTYTARGAIEPVRRYLIEEAIERVLRA